MAETVGDEFPLRNESTVVPVSITNLSSESSYFLLVGSGSACMALDRLTARGWHEEYAGPCPQIAGMMELGPGETFRSEALLWVGPGVYRFRLAVSDDAAPPGVVFREVTNAFSLRPQGRAPSS